jgi:predicted nucleic acid-binding protein
MKRRKIYYWDSSVMIAFLGGEAGRSENVEQIFEEAESGEVFIVTSSFTLVEVIKLKGKTPIRIDAQQRVTKFFEKDYFLFVDATRKITEAARALIWANPTLFPKDSVHLASAIEFHKKRSLDALHSYDKDFLGFNGKSLISCPIEEPVPPQPVLPMKVERAQKKQSRRLIELDDD